MSAASVKTWTLDTTNDQTLTVVVDAASGAVTLRVAKQGHNRAVAKLDADTARTLAIALNHLDG
jgi:hypothetical protein